MSVNSLSSSAVEFSPPQVALDNAKGVAQANTRSGSEESARAVSASVNGRAHAAENAQVLNFDADKQTRSVNQGNSEQLARQAKEKLQEKRQPSQDELTQALEVTNQLSSLQQRKLQFTSSQEDGRTIIKVVDRENDEVIRQIPSEDFVKLAKRISELTQQLDSAQGLLFESKV